MWHCFKNVGVRCASKFDVMCGGVSKVIDDGDANFWEFCVREGREVIDSVTVTVTITVTVIITITHFHYYLHYHYSLSVLWLGEMKVTLLVCYR